MNLICGINPVLEALHAGTRHFDRILVVKGLRNRRISEATARATQLGIPLRFEARETLDRMAGGVPHQGLIAVVSEKPLLDFETLVGQARDPAFLVILDGVEDPRNLGAILRTAEAAGADGVVLPERHSAGLSETTARASAGAVEHVRVARVGNVAQALQALKERGVWVVGFDAAGTERWDTVDLRRPVALVLGGEGRGMRRLVRERCDHLVSLPLFGHVSSLNVSVAAGIAFYELIRQRGLIPSHVRPIPLATPPPLRQVVGPSADDLEHDPGHLGQPSPVEAHEPEEDDEAPLDLIRIHEEAAWAVPAGPAAERPRRERPRPPGPGREGGGREAPRPQEKRDRDGQAGSPPSDRRRGRRRRWGRPRGNPAAPAPPAGEASAPPKAETSGGGPDGPPGGRPGGRRRRRRRPRP
jgi:23S rRNA (guanosine2251-2'-O)-methyltransferase